MMKRLFGVCAASLLIFYLIAFMARPLYASFNAIGPTRDDLYIIEVENFESNIKRLNHYWQKVSYPKGLNGQEAMAVLPNNGRKVSRNYKNLSPCLTFKIDFDQAGPYYVWIRGCARRNDNTLHVGLNDQSLASARNITFVERKNWTWTNFTGRGQRAYIQVAHPGRQIFDIWMQDDGLILDKILLTTNPFFKPENSLDEGANLTVAYRNDNSNTLNASGIFALPMVDAGDGHTVGLASNGLVRAVGYNAHGQLNVKWWSDVVQLSAGEYSTVGLKSDGTVVATGYNAHGQLDVNSWRDIVQVAVGHYETFGLKSDGTVVSVGHRDPGQQAQEPWTNIVQVAAGMFHTVGLKSDGTVVAMGDNLDGQLEVDSWTDIVQVAVGKGHTIGLKSNGTVVSVGYNGYNQTEVESWTGICQVAAGGYHTVGLKNSGKVVAVGRDVDGQLSVGTWTGIVQVAAGKYHTVGLKSDGTVVCVGKNDWDQNNVSSWNLLGVR